LEKVIGKKKIYEEYKGFIEINRKLLKREAFVIERG
jgi:hypothetical protein